MTSRAIPRGFRTSTCRIKPQRGLVLVIVLWVITLLTVIAASFAYSMRTEANLVRNTVDQTKARYLVEAGIERAILAMLDPDPAKRWPADGTTHQFSLADGTVQVSVRDEAGFIDLNRASPILLNGMFRVAGVEERERAALVDAVLDWRDRDSLRRLNGAEDDQYRQAGRSYGAKDDKFEAIEELQLVLGMSPQLFRRLRGWVTVHARRGINQAAAPREVLLALPGTDAGSVDALLENRQSADQSVPNARRANRRAAGTYRIIATATLASGASARTVAVIRTQGKAEAAFSVLEWQTGT